MECTWPAAGDPQACSSSGANAHPRCPCPPLPMQQKTVAAHEVSLKTAEKKAMLQVGGWQRCFGHCGVPRWQLLCTCHDAEAAVTACWSPLCALPWPAAVRRCRRCARSPWRRCSASRTGSSASTGSSPGEADMCAWGRDGWVPATHSTCLIQLLRTRLLAHQQHLALPVWPCRVHAGAAMP